MGGTANALQDCIVGVIVFLAHFVLPILEGLGDLGELLSDGVVDLGGRVLEFLPT